MIAFLEAKKLVSDSVKKDTSYFITKLAKKTMKPNSVMQIINELIVLKVIFF